MKILLFPRTSRDTEALARSLLPEGMEMVAVDRGAGDEVLIDALASCDVLMGFILQPLSEQVVRAMGCLKLVQLLSAGYEGVDLKAMRDMGVPVATNGAANAVGVAEHAILLMMAVMRNLVYLDTQAKAGRWRPGGLDALKLYELDGKTVGIVGLGAIGRETAKRLKPFCVTTLYCGRRRAEEAVEKELEVTYTSLDELLRVSDVVTLHVPLNDSTFHMIGREQLRAMKRSAVLINTCRGGVVDTDALYEALKEGIIAGAGLDTLEQEPPPADLPILSLPNVTITPHLSGVTVESWTKRMILAFANIQRLANDEKPLWLVPELR